MFTNLNSENNLPKKHRGACKRGMMDKLAAVECAWENHHPIDWGESTVLDYGRGQELLVKKADGGLGVPGCWTAVM